MTSNRATFPRVVIIGAGFGGLSTAKQLAQAPFDVTIVNRHNYHYSLGHQFWKVISERLRFEMVDAPGGMLP
jgi:NADH dehydrogenase FAD-containing subunit